MQAIVCDVLFTHFFFFSIYLLSSYHICFDIDRMQSIILLSTSDIVDKQDHRLASSYALSIPPRMYCSFQNSYTENLIIVCDIVFSVNRLQGPIKGHQLQKLFQDDHIQIYFWTMKHNLGYQVQTFTDDTKTDDDNEAVIYRSQPRAEWQSVSAN